VKCTEIDKWTISRLCREQWAVVCVYCECCYLRSAASVGDTKPLPDFAFSHYYWQ
jgi:hypothetical protein